MFSKAKSAFLWQIETTLPFKLWSTNGEKGHDLNKQGLQNEVSMDPSLREAIAANNRHPRGLDFTQRTRLLEARRQDLCQVGRGQDTSTAAKRVTEPTWKGLSKPSQQERRRLGATGRRPSKPASN